MKKIFYLAAILTLFANVNTFSATRKLSSSKKSSFSQSQAEPVKVVLRFLREYVSSGSDYIDNTDLISEKFRTKYYKERARAIEENGILDYVQIVGNQDPAEDYDVVSYNPNTGVIVLKSVYSGYDGESDSIKLKVKQVNGKWIIDDYTSYY